MTVDTLTLRLSANIAHLREHQSSCNWSLRELFAADPNRAQNFCLKAPGIVLDFSKNLIRQDTLVQLLEYAREARISEKIDALFSGANVNGTEHRPALHSALRFQGVPQTAHEQAVAECRSCMQKFVEQIHSGSWRGFSGKCIRHIVNIGIGGSDLGPRMVVAALHPWLHQSVNVHFVSNLDGSDLTDTLENLPPESTLFIVASKSFSTLETRQNAISARQWMLTAGCSKDQLAKHFVAVSSNPTAAQDFDIAAENIFPMWDWVGGRYSLWSAIGLPIALACGFDTYQTLLTGAEAMDKHFAETPLQQNMPICLALMHFWYRQCWGAGSFAVLPYAQRLAQFPAWLQQLDMESLGKSVDTAGQHLSYPSGSVVWGGAGTNGQHSFYQLLHQGTDIIPVDFIAIKQASSPLDEQHKWLLASCLSQSRVLLQGRTLAEARRELERSGHTHKEVHNLAPHKVIPGNRPSNTLIVEKLDAYHLGALLALYEHKVFAFSCLLNINPFDQWSVELGKLCAEQVYNAADGGIPTDWDSSTAQLIQLVFK